MNKEEALQAIVKSALTHNDVPIDDHTEEVAWTANDAAQAIAPLRRLFKGSPIAEKIEEMILICETIEDFIEENYN